MVRIGLTVVAVLVAVTAAWGDDPAKGSFRLDSGVLLINPHEEPARCPSCHDRIPDDREARAGQYFLHQPTTDETCAMCHPTLCCDSSVKHTNHPTGIDRWNDPKFRRPKTLPLFDGFITCSTCHFHRERDAKREFWLLRIVALGKDGKPDWAGLCRDCHVDY